MAEEIKIPAVILELAKTVKGNPLSWKINADDVVIIFEDGRKLIFDVVADQSENKSKKKEK